MVDTIGRCECINTSDKLEILQLISNEINKTDTSMERIETGRKEISEFGGDPDKLIKIQEQKKSKLAVLLKRVENTPYCKSTSFDKG